MTEPLVSVVMPVYNAAPFLSEAIESILGQTYPRLELVIADNGSVDASLDIIRDYATRDVRLRYVALSHGGHARAANAVIAETRGDWIARMDADDIALPDRVAAQLAWATERGVEVCGGLVELFGDTGGRWWFPESPDGVRRDLLFRCAMIHPTLLMRAGIARANRYDETSTFDDYELITRLAPRHTLGNMQRVLVRYRRHAAQTHVVRDQRIQADFRKYRFRYFYDLFPGVPVGDYLALARVSDRQPLRTLTELDRAGAWLAELADLPDRELRTRLAQRWREAWARSPHLHATGADLFHHHLGRIDPAPPR